MNRLVIISGIVIAILGTVMTKLLDQLQSETFRGDLPPWILISYALTGVGLAIIGFGVISKRVTPRLIESVAASRLFSSVSMVNAVVAGLLVLPVLVPSLEFPILITRWPGIYMVVAYYSFVVVGVIGTFGWSLVFLHIGDVFRRRGISRFFVILQLAGLEAGICFVVVFMFWGGYVGSLEDYPGFGAAIVGSNMEFSVIPAAIGIFLVVLSTILGVANIYFSNYWNGSRNV